MNKIDKIRHLHHFFIERFKPKKPIMLRFSSKIKGHGSYSYCNKKHIITLNKKDHYFTLIDSEIHEFAHALEYNKVGKQQHSDAWGKAFAKVYRVYLEWLDKYTV